MDIDYVQRFASLRHRAELRHDVMARALVHARALGLDEGPANQLIDLVSWVGDDQCGLILTVDFDTFRVVCSDAYGNEEVHEASINDENQVYGLVHAGVDFFLS